jgi:hypothetical protein
MDIEVEGDIQDQLRDLYELLQVSLPYHMIVNILQLYKKVQRYNDFQKTN